MLCTKNQHKATLNKLKFEPKCNKHIIQVFFLQVVKLTDDSEACFEEKQKAGLVLVDLKAAYDSVWHQGLTLKLLQVVLDRQMMQFIVNILSNCSFKLKTSDGQ